MELPNSADIGFCPYVGHTSSVILTWQQDKVIAVECACGDHETCGFSDVCELYQRRPVGFTHTPSVKENSI